MIKGHQSKNRCAQSVQCCSPRPWPKLGEDRIDVYIELHNSCLRNIIVLNGMVSSMLFKLFAWPLNCIFLTYEFL